MVRAKPLRFQRLIPGLILILQLCLTVSLSALLGIRVDETYTLHTTSRDLSYAIQQALRWELQPPLYFAALQLWRHLGDSIFVARLLSVTATSIGVFVSGLAAKTYLSEELQNWFMAVVAFNPFIVASAVDARVYAFVFLWSALLLWLFWNAFLRSPSRWIWPASFSIVAIAAVYTQYYSCLLLVGLACVLLFRRRWRELRAFALWSLPVAAIASPLLLGLKSEIETNAANYACAQSLAQNAASFIRVLGSDIIPLDWAAARLLAGGLVIVVLVMMILRSDKQRLWKSCATPLIILGAGGSAFVVAVTVARASLTPHYVSTFHVAALILLFGILSSGTSSSGSAQVSIAASLLLLTSVGSLYADYRHLAKPGDSKNVAWFLMANEKPGQRIAIFDAQEALAVAYHYSGKNRIAPIPRPVRYDRFLLSDIAIHTPAEVADALGYQRGKHAKLWLVTPGTESCNPVLRCDLLYAFVAKHYATLTDRRFYGAQVRLLEQR